MVFPFEYGLHGGAENERQILRRLIYNEALLFNQQPEMAEPDAFVRRHRSLTLGAIPERSSAPVNSSFRDRTSRKVMGRGAEYIADPFNFLDDKNNCCVF